MAPAVLLTGKPGCGKTAVIRRTLERLSRPAGGFYTREILRGGSRTGFEIVTLEGRCGILAHVDIKGKARLGKYGLDLDALEDLGVGAVQAALRAGSLVVIDEIGPMEIASPLFRETVRVALEHHAGLLGTIVRRSIPFSDAVKRHAGVNLIEVTYGNRDLLPAKLVEVFGAANANAR